MSARQNNNARRGSAGKVSKTDRDQRRNHTLRGGHGDSLPEPVAAHHSHVNPSSEAQGQRIVEMLRRGARHTLVFRRFGIIQSQTRVFELRALDDSPTGAHDFIPLDPGITFTSTQQDVYLVFSLVTASYDEGPLTARCFKENAELAGAQAAVAQDHLIMSTNDQSGYFVLPRPADGWATGL